MARNLKVVFSAWSLTVLFFLLSPALGYETLQGPTELRFWDQARALD